MIRPLASYARLLCAALLFAAPGCACGSPDETTDDHASSAEPGADPGASPPMPEPIADPDFLEQYTVTRRFTVGLPGHYRFTPDARAVLFTRSAPRTNVQDLFVLELPAEGADSAHERVLLTAQQVLAGAEEELSEEERARRERMRLSSRGITAYDLSPDRHTILVPLSGRLFLVDREHAGEHGSVRELTSTAGYPIDPRFSPDGHSIAVVRDGDLYVIDVATGMERRLTTRASETIEHGTAEFVAQEEMGRMEGYWWSPDSRTLLVQETESSGVERMHILDPMHPESEPSSPAYPRPGMPNARVRLFTIAASGGTPTWLEWDREALPYLATARFSPDGTPFVVLQDRLQQRVEVRSWDAAARSWRTLVTETDDAWINIDQDVPRFLAGGAQFLWTSEREGEWRVEIRQSADGALVRTLTPEGFGHHSILAVDEAGGRMIVSGSREPTQMHLWSMPLSGEGAPTLLGAADEASDAATHEATFAADASAWVELVRTLDGAPSARVVRTEGNTVVGAIETLVEEPAFAPNVTIETVGEREFRAAIVRPRNFDASRRYPVLVHVYAGPGFQQVLAERNRFLLNQWYADHGFIVVSFDGRGTPMRGRAWERAIRSDFITVPLEDQVAALTALAAAHPELDMQRVGIFGWSFGGYFSSMAVLRRPDVFRCGIAGAPVTEWRDYDTHYTERYLGLPEPEGQTGPYAESSVLTFARRTEGEMRPLLIVHGTADDNVYFSHAIKLSDAMFRAGRPFELLPLAGLTHMVTEPEVARRLQARMVDFFRTHLAAR